MTALKSKIGYDRDSEEFRTNTRRLAQFAEAIGDTNPAHLEGRIASPVFHHVPVMQSMVEVLNKVASGFIMHGEHDFHFHAPIVPGQRLFSVSTLTGIRSSPAGALYLIRSDTRTHDGKDICTQYATCLIQKRKVAQNLGKKNPEKPEPARTGNPETVTYPIAGDLTLKYADAARDYSPYTIDPAVAKSLGLPAPIVHGMCTLALISRAIVDGACKGDTRRLKRLGCRFSHPLYLRPGQDLVASLWAGKKAVAFEATDAEGNVVVKNGFAEVA
ncbi:MAG: MaoC/PaaZ C-terminal domain-containing protein [Hyphomicrobiales bacterium]